MERKKIVLGSLEHVCNLLLLRMRLLTLLLILLKRLGPTGLRKGRETREWL